MSFGLLWLVCWKRIGWKKEEAGTLPYDPFNTLSTLRSDQVPVKTLLQQSPAELTTPFPRRQAPKKLQTASSQSNCDLLGKPQCLSDNLRFPISLYIKYTTTTTPPRNYNPPFLSKAVVIKFDIHLAMKIHSPLWVSFLPILQKKAWIAIATIARLFLSLVWSIGSPGPIVSPLFLLRAAGRL
ncbi:hypothetical protein PGT21_009991 [Puccinia graminis f. sp. tritici]|uniref:Uncharacterized protein n=1 Tax=Puccinia graminis f. sp. tritici TaxID=56615 RepID=A0A5B0QSV7_PUCGR|nr:hypothetical protein PGT21_009991 [Puccinia graminis f. sp. tritici]